MNFIKLIRNNVRKFSSKNNNKTYMENNIINPHVIMMEVIAKNDEGVLLKILKKLN